MSAEPTPTDRARRANIVGTGLIGASVGLALADRGWLVSGTDADDSVLERALEIGAVAARGLDPEAEITFVATPVGGVVEAVRRALDETGGIVTDVGSVKAIVADAVVDERFVPGHPMAGSEQDGVAGADATMFQGAVWVLTPTSATSDTAFARVRAIVADLGADVITLDADRHDALVAMVSHVPHLTAGTLMRLADRRSEEHLAVLRLAAGGFRDMTRIAAGHPGIWPDICVSNKSAIVAVLDDLIDELGRVRSMVDEEDRVALSASLETARRARRNLPTTAPRPSELAEVRIPVQDRPGEIASVATLAAELDVNIYSLEIAHSAEGARGTIIILVDDAIAERMRGGLLARGYRPAVRTLE